MDTEQILEKAERQRQTVLEKFTSAETEMEALKLHFKTLSDELDRLDFTINFIKGETANDEGRVSVVAPFNVDRPGDLTFVNGTIAILQSEEKLVNINKLVAQFEAWGKPTDKKRLSNNLRGNKAVESDGKGNWGLAKWKKKEKSMWDADVGKALASVADIHP